MKVTRSILPLTKVELILQDHGRIDGQKLLSIDERAYL